MENRENLLGILETFFRWKKPILTLTALAAIGTVLISLTLSNYYQASTIYYVASPDQAMPEPVGSRLKVKALYGADADIDRNLSIAQSSELISFMIDSFELYEHYEIKRDAKNAASKVQKKFLKLYTVERTKYDAVEISIEDTDKELAMRMTIAARQKVAEISERLIKESIKKNLESIKSNIDSKETELKLMGDSLQRVREKFGILNPESQTEFLSSALASAESKLTSNQAKLQSLRQAPGIPRDTINLIAAHVAGLEQEVILTKEKIASLGEGLPTVEALGRSYVDGVKQLSLDKQRYKQEQAAYNANPPVLFLVEEASVPLEKSRPKRSIICIAAILIAFLMGLMAALLLDMYKDTDWNKIINAR